MNHKLIINKRIIDALNYIFNFSEGKKRGDFAKELGVSPAKISEIMSFRMMAGTEIIAHLCSSYNISCSWIILGSGSMLKDSANEIEPLGELANKSNVPPETLSILKDMLAEKDRQIAELNQKIGGLNEQLRQFRSRTEDNNGDTRYPSSADGMPAARFDPSPAENLIAPSISPP